MKRTTTARRQNRHLWVLEGLRDLPSCTVKPMFGAQACYFNDLLVLVLADSEEPWRGLLVPCEREHHASIMREFPALTPHPVLPKWLYLGEAAGSFERDAERIVRRIQEFDARFGIVPPAKRAKGAKAAPKGKKARFGRPIP